MAKKRRQHFVPKVYLKPFLDSRLPAGWPESRPFEPAVWVLDPSLRGSPARRSPSNILWKNSLYTLRNDDPAAPAIEEALVVLEGAYDRVSAKVQGRKRLTLSEYEILCLFIGALFGRIPEQMDHWQRTVDEVERLYRMMASQDVADEYWRGSEETGKRMVLTYAQSHASIVGPGGFLLVNESPMKFITSDSPVLHTFLHTDESPIRLFDEKLRVGAGTNRQEFFSYVALGPDTAFVSSPLLSNEKRLWAITDDANLVFSLNQWVRHRAVKTVISSEQRPYGRLTATVIAAEAAERAEYRPRTGLQVKTADQRFWIGATDIRHGVGSHPLHGRVTFFADAQPELMKAVSDPHLTEVLIVKDDQEVGGMRDCWFAAVGLAAGCPTVVENWPGGWPDYERRS